MKGIIFLPPAEEEMLDAARFYESRVRGLGREFLAEVRHASEKITEHPEAATPIRANIRRRLIKRFPFGILYINDPDEIVIVAVMHLRQRPGYWRGRL